MPTLDWIGKKAVVNHHRQVPFRLLRERPELSVGDPASGNLLVQGDNLLALKALLPYYAGKVKCIYIDPPYNTGNEGWVYNDAVNSPEIRRWLGQVVGPEAQDLSRHDKWLCMMYPRLALLREFLSEDGAIFVTIDDTEIAGLLLLTSEIFGERNHLCTVIWQHSVQPKGYSGNFSIHHNYLVAYRRSERFILKDVARREEHNLHYANPDDDPKGPWRAGDVRNALFRPNLIYDLVTPSGKVIKPPSKGWRWSRQTMADKIASGEIVFRDEERRIVRKIYLKDQQGRPPESIWFGEDVGTTREANQELKVLFDGQVPFETPKPVKLIRRVLEVATDGDCLVLDSFAGSGTTAQAVLEQNNDDKGNRRFILVELDPEVCEKVTYERVSRVVKGRGEYYSQGGGFRYCTLGESLFDEAGSIRKTVTFSELAAHVFFTETGAPVPQPVDTLSPLLGTHGGKAVYLLFNGVLGDRRPAGGNVLTGDVLQHLPAFDGARVVYGEGCRLGADRLRQEGVVFRQIPYEIKVS
jgi:DNA modification methylase